jgi:hypothetical protein
MELRVMMEMPVQIAIRVLPEFVRVCPFPIVELPLQIVMTVIFAQPTAALAVLVCIR